jgi:hypothetical protein
MSTVTTKTVKQALKKIGERAGFTCKNEYRVMFPSFKRPFAYVDHVWMKEEPFQTQEIPMVSFEINVNPKYLGNSKKLKGDIMNLRLVNAAIGYLVVPYDRAKKELKDIWPSWTNDLESYLDRVVEMAKPSRVRWIDLDVVLNRAIV